MQGAVNRQGVGQGGITQLQGLAFRHRDAAWASDGGIGGDQRGLMSLGEVGAQRGGGTGNKEGASAVEWAGLPAELAAVLGQGGGGGQIERAGGAKGQGIVIESQGQIGCQRPGAGISDRSAGVHGQRLVDCQPALVL